MRKISGLPPRKLEYGYLEILLRHRLLQESASLYAPLNASSRKYPSPSPRLGLRRGERGYRISPSARFTSGAGTDTPVETRQFDDVQQAFVDSRRIVVLGDPGAGKSTALQRLTHALAQAALDDVKAPLPFYARLGDWTNPDKTPLVFLQEQIASVAEYASENPREQDELRQPLRDLAAFLEKLCQAKRAILLLDGLNELPSWHREVMVKSLRDWLDKLPRELPVHIACRRDDYREPAKLAFDELTIEPLTISRIREAIQFTFDWLAEIDEIKNPERKAEGLYQALTQEKDTGGLLTLARNPYLLSLLILLWEEGEERLPDNQTQLFKFFTDSLLEKEGLMMLDENVGIASDPTPAGEHLLECLSSLAWELQTQRTDQVQEVGGDVGVLTTLSREAAMARLGPFGVKRAIDTHLLEVRSRARFTHQYLQEYFTARGMRARIRNGRLRASELWRNPWDRGGWEMATRLLAGLYPEDCTPVLDWLDDSQPEVTADCILKSGAHTPESVKKGLKNRWLPRLTDPAREPNARTRAALGRALGRLGWDDRKGVGCDPRTDLPDIDWAKIPSGEFLYGKVKQKRRLSAFRISRYPITTAQFDAFIRAGGYGEPRWWKGLDERFEQPAPPFWDEPNHPRQTVNWYEAMAFCAWLGHRMGLPITLPTEAQWEKATRGTDGRPYPWGNEWREGMANTYAAGIDRTTAVGIFPRGQSPYGIMDLAGNVWEWCLNEYTNPRKTGRGGNKPRVLRGGSSDPFETGACADLRDNFKPSDRFYSIGFRVVCSRISSR